MSKKEKLLKKARSSPKNFLFSELCSLAEHAGFEFRNFSGSHKIYSHPKIKEKLLNLQPDNKDKSKSKKYQINQLLSFIDDYDLIKG